MIRAGQPVEPAPGATTASRTLRRPATADQEERTEPVRNPANDEVGSGHRSARPGSPLRIPLALRHEHEVPKSAPKTPKYSKLIPKQVEACSVQSYSSFISHFLVVV